MRTKKSLNFKSPDTSKLQEVRIDDRTRIYVSQDTDPVEAKKRYLARIAAKEGTISGKK